MSICGICGICAGEAVGGKTWSQILDSIPILSSEDCRWIDVDVKAVRSVCGAVFHNKCLIEWLLLSKNPTCPNVSCRLIESCLAAIMSHFEPAKLESITDGKNVMPSGVGDHDIVGGGSASASSEALACVLKDQQKKPVPTVTTEYIYHLEHTTEITTYYYAGKSDLVKGLEANPLSDDAAWKGCAPWVETERPKEAQNEAAIVEFDQTGGSIARGDSIGNQSSSSRSHTHRSHRSVTVIRRRVEEPDSDNDDDDDDGDSDNSMGVVPYYCPHHRPRSRAVEAERGNRAPRRGMLRGSRAHYFFDGYTIRRVDI